MKNEEIRITAICTLNCAEELGIIIEKTFLNNLGQLPDEVGKKVGAHLVNDWVVTKTGKGYSFRLCEKEQSK